MEETKPPEWEAAQKALAALKPKQKLPTQTFNYTEGVVQSSYPMVMPYAPTMMMGGYGGYNPYYPLNNMYPQSFKPPEVKPPSLYNDKAKLQAFGFNPIIVDTVREEKEAQQQANSNTLSKFNVNMLKAALKSNYKPEISKEFILKRPLLSSGKKPAKMDSSNYPTALREYVNRCLSLLKDETELAKVKDIIAKSFKDGTVWTKDWAKEPIPSKIKPLSPVHTNKRNYKSNNYSESRMKPNNHNYESPLENDQDFVEPKKSFKKAGQGKKSLYLPPKGEHVPLEKYKERKRKDYYFYGDRRRKKEGGRPLKKGVGKDTYKSFLGTTPVFKAVETHHEDGTLVDEYISDVQSSSTSYSEDDGSQQSGSRSRGSSKSQSPSENRRKRTSSTVSGGSSISSSTHKISDNKAKKHRRKRHERGSRSPNNGEEGRNRRNSDKSKWQNGNNWNYDYGTNAKKDWDGQGNRYQNKKFDNERYYNQPPKQGNDLNQDDSFETNLKIHMSSSGKMDKIFTRRYPGGNDIQPVNPHGKRGKGKKNIQQEGLNANQAFKINQGDVSANQELLEKRSNRFKLNEEQEFMGKRAHQLDYLNTSGDNNMINRFGILGIQYNDSLDGTDAANIDWTKIHVVGTSTNLERPYLRLTSAPDPEIIRPASILYKSLLLIQSKWCSEHNYHYACEQLKSIRQDLIVQNIRDSLTVAVYETHCRIALEMADREEFNQCQTQLQALYEEGQTSKFKEEFIAYQILYHMFTNSSIDLNITLGNLSPEVAQNPMIQFVIHLHAAWSIGNYHKFFKLYAKKALRMAAYLIDWFILRERKLAIEKIIRAYKQSKLPMSFLVEELAFADDESCKEFLRSLDLSLTPQDEADDIFDCKTNNALIK